MQVIQEKLADPNVTLVGLLRDPDQRANLTHLPVIVIVPGGSYTHIPIEQAESLALAFAGHGFQAFYLNYSFISDFQPLHLHPVYELGLAIKTLHQHALDWHIDPNQITAAGFSAGGHVVALYNDYWHDQVATQLQVDSADLKLANVILSYPVISPLLGFPTTEATLAQWTDDPDVLAAEQHVNKNNRPTFIWATTDDPVVPAKNSLAYANALATANIDYELHLFQHGPHGLALANAQTAWKPDANQPHVAHWLSLALEWLQAQKATD
ncbi:alpha/beta hydrolase [Lactiplantibacillus mudanjiangensis]|uniref:Esterase [Lactobacillus paraplantarum] n=1 Tax=Lactiplantibacillus mudanjiangensis TaxID=1296538 RepID=A0A660E8P8_9LACO|nr:alpha/beta hydrolase [Lactiplantibacillus mudanjiangensis]VDG17716.1 esterase [Lactobacillus paraplantarum] [Lactiplantibacillus mudanjiangensis]VDG25112.1 esterase [Lactobacillus paraplantarum] [Lactiplantibacillus mudanjiangensis]VDG29479.1 esterase [Lactobacillus paraplantarum] [Lactiplantibacillus mudanjiangensis]